jgi:hypothetical protein
VRVVSLGERVAHAQRVEPDHGVFGGAGLTSAAGSSTAW